MKASILREMMSRWQSEGFSAELQQQVLNHDNPELAYRFAYAVEGTDLDLMEEVILRSEDHRLVYDFALLKSERGGDIGRLQQRILVCEDPGLMTLFAADIEGADIEAFRDKLAQHPNPKFHHLFELEMRNKGYE